MKSLFFRKKTILASLALAVLSPVVFAHTGAYSSIKNTGYVPIRIEITGTPCMYNAPTVFNDKIIGPGQSTSAPLIEAGSSCSYSQVDYQFFPTVKNGDKILGNYLQAMYEHGLYIIPGPNKKFTYTSHLDYKKDGAHWEIDVAYTPAS